jgi:hypothetical protein
MVLISRVGRPRRAVGGDNLQPLTQGALSWLAEIRLVIAAAARWPRRDQVQIGKQLCNSQAQVSDCSHTPTDFHAGASPARSTGAAMTSNRE